MAASDEINVKITAETSGLDQLSAKIGKAEVDLSKFGAAARAQITAAMGLGNASAAAGQQTAALGSAVQAASAQITHGLGDVNLATAGTTREFLVLAHEVISGNFSRIPGSLIVLGERMGNLHTIIEAINPAWAASAAGAAAFALAIGEIVVEAVRMSDNLTSAHDSLTLMGQGLVTSVEQLGQFRSRAQEAFALSNSEARAAVDAFGALPRVTLEQADALVALAAEISKVKGLDFAETARDIAKEAARGGDALLEWAKKFGIEDAAAEDSVKTLKAGHEATEALEVAIKSITAQVEAQVGAWVRDTAALKNFIDTAASMGEAGIFAVQAMPGVGPPARIPPSHPPATGPTTDFAAIDRQRALQKELVAEEKDRYDAAVIRLRTAIAETDDKQKKIALTKQLNALELEHANNSFKAQAEAAERISAIERKKEPKGPKAPKGPGDVSIWEAELHHQLETEQHFFNDSKAEELAFWQAKVNMTKDGSKERLSVESKIFEASKQLARQNEQDAIAEQTHAQRVNDEQTARKRAQIQTDIALGRLTTQEGIAAERNLVDEKWKADEAYYEKKLEAAKNDSRESLKLSMEEFLAHEKMTTQKAALDNKSLETTHAAWKQVGDAITSAIDTSVQGVIMGTTTIRQAFANLGQSILLTFVNLGIKKAVSSLFDSVWEGISGGKGLFSGLGGIGQLFGAGAGGAAAGAAGAAAGGGGFFSGLAALFPFLALEGGGVVPSARGGWQVPSFASGGIPAVLHGGEMVLPKHISESVQSMANGGGGGGGMNLHFHGPADGQSIHRWVGDTLRQNPNFVGDLFKKNALTPRTT